MPTVIVTGCSRPTGFGQLTAERLARAGFHVFATMREVSRGAELEAWAKSAGVRLNTLEHDVTDAEQNRFVVNEVLAQADRIDALVNNVGMSSFGALETLHDSHIRQAMETNFFSAVDMTRAVLPAMRAQASGRVLFVTSIAGVTGVPGESIYCASKFALEGLAESLSMEVARFGIDISTVRPSFFNTGMSRDNTDAATFFRMGTAYDEFNRRVVTSTSEGEVQGEDARLVAEMVHTALTTTSPRLRWNPGKAAPEILNARRSMDDARWREYVMDELDMAAWLDSSSQEIAS